MKVFPIMLEATNVVGDGDEIVDPEDQETPPEPERDETWTAHLLSSEGTWSDAIGRMGGAMGLAAVYGVALGTRAGGMSFASHAMGVAGAFAAVLALGVPALFIVLSLFDAPIDGRSIARCAGRGAAASGLTLAGLAPAASLFVVSTEGRAGAALVAVAGLCLAAMIGLRHFYQAMAEALTNASDWKRSVSMLAFSVFVIFAGLLAARICVSTLPILGGGL